MRVIWRWRGDCSGPTLLLNASVPPTLMSLVRDPKGLLVLDILAHQLTKVTKHELKARSDVLWPPLTYIPRSAQCLMGYLRRGEGGTPTPSPPKASWGLLLIGSCSSSRDPFFSIKTTVPFHTSTHG